MRLKRYNISFEDKDFNVMAYCPEGAYWKAVDKLKLEKTELHKMEINLA